MVPKQVHIVFFDSHEREQLLPLTYLRSTADLMVGMRTIKEKWMDSFDAGYSIVTPAYLQGLYPLIDLDKDSECLYINGASLPSTNLIKAIIALQANEGLKKGEQLIALKAQMKQGCTPEDVVQLFDESQIKEVAATVISYPEDILTMSRSEFLKDYEIMTREKTSQALDPSSKHRGNDLFIGHNTKIYDAIINTEEGPVYIDDDVEVMENAVIKGPVYIGKRTKIHVGAKVYADTMLGEQCRIGGEIKRTTIFGFSNKAHEGYLGDSVLGKWCNLGADTNNSNLKNTYGLISLWDLSTQSYRTTDRNFLGMIVGDHTMAAINTSFNTGTVTGVFSNILDRAPDRFMPSFSWGKEAVYKVDKAISVAKTVFDRRSLKMADAYESAIRHIASS